MCAARKSFEDELDDLLPAPKPPLQGADPGQSLQVIQVSAPELKKPADDTKGTKEKGKPETNKKEKPAPAGTRLEKNKKEAAAIATTSKEKLVWSFRVPEELFHYIRKTLGKRAQIMAIENDLDIRKVDAHTIHCRAALSIYARLLAEEDIVKIIDGWDGVSALEDTIEEYLVAKLKGYKVPLQAF